MALDIADLLEDADRLAQEGVDRLIPGKQRVGELAG